jgi:hypothetical protein
LTGSGPSPPTPDRNRPPGIHTWLAIAGLGAVLLAGCGNEERLSDDEFAQRLGAIERQVSSEFSNVVGGQGGRQVSDPSLEGFAVTLERSADELRERDPPEGVEAVSARFARGMDEQASFMRELADGPQLTVNQVLTKLESAAARRRLHELASAGRELAQLGYIENQ